MNKAKAFELYKISTKEGNRKAQISLGVLYENGKGIEKDLEQAIYWYNKAADEDGVAQYNFINLAKALTKQKHLNYIKNQQKKNIIMLNVNLEYYMNMKKAQKRIWIKLFIGIVKRQKNNEIAAIKL